MAQIHLREAGSNTEIQEVAADKGYHLTDVKNQLTDKSSNYRTCIPESKQPQGTHLGKNRKKQQRREIEANRLQMKWEHRLKGAIFCGLKGSQIRRLVD